MIKLLDILKELKIQSEYSILKIIIKNDIIYKYYSPLLDEDFRIIHEGDISYYDDIDIELNKGDLFSGYTSPERVKILITILKYNNIFYKRMINDSGDRPNGIVIPKDYYVIISQ